MHILCTGLDHHTAPVELRERVSLTNQALVAALAGVRALPGVEQAALLQTCNRTEVWTASRSDVKACIREWLVALSGVRADALSCHLYQKVGLEAATHLCRVAAGVESQVLGESEILGQVRAAADAARDAETLGTELDRLFSTAVKAGKRARSETRISCGAFSIGRCAVETARGVFGGLQGRSVLILGAGKIAESTVRHLHSQGADTVLVANRTFGAAQELVGRLGGRALRYDQIAEGLAEADIVISSTSAPHFVLLPEHVAAAMSRRAGRDLLLLDIAVPRDIDPRVGRIPRVHLCDIDDLTGGLEAAVADRAADLESAEIIAREVAQEFCEWLAAREAVPLLAAMRDHFEQVRREQLGRFASRLDALPPRDREWIEELTRGLVSRLLHEPTANLKQELAAGNGLVAELVMRMYHLEPRGQQIAGQRGRGRVTVPASD